MGGMGFPPGMLPPGMRRIPMTGGASRRFDELYRAYPVAMMPGSERENVNHGGKVIMPPSALDKLTRLHITYPMLFELVNGTKETKTHAGVLEFIAEEGKIYLPYWVCIVFQICSYSPIPWIGTGTADMKTSDDANARPRHGRHGSDTLH